MGIIYIRADPFYIGLIQYMDDILYNLRLPHILPTILTIILVVVIVCIFKFQRFQ